MVSTSTKSIITIPLIQILNHDFKRFNRTALTHFELVHSDAVTYNLSDPDKPQRTKLVNLVFAVHVYSLICMSPGTRTIPPLTRCVYSLPKYSAPT